MSDFEPFNENLFQVEQLYGDVNVKAAATTVRCPHCRQLGSFNFLWGSAETQDQGH
jgi:hypothetical protein